MKNAFELLKLATETFPTESCNHSLTLQKQSLVLTLFIKDKWNSFILFESDFDKSSKEIMEIVCDYLREYLKI